MNKLQIFINIHLVHVYNKIAFFTVNKNVFLDLFLKSNYTCSKFNKFSILLSCLFKLKTHIEYAATLSLLVVLFYIKCEDIMLERCKCSEESW